MSQATRELLRRAAATDTPVLGAERAMRRGERLRQWRRAQIALPVVVVAVLAMASAGRVLHVGDVSRIAPAGPGDTNVREPRQEQQSGRTEPGSGGERAGVTAGSMPVPGQKDIGPAVDASAGTAPGDPQREAVSSNPISAGPGRLVFVSKRDGNAEIYAVDRDGSNLRRLTNSAFDDLWPTWSPDGKRIAFVSNRLGNYEIYTMRADGTDERRVGGIAGEQASSVSWSPDGRRFAFISSTGQAPHLGYHRIAVMNVDGSGRRFVTTAGDELSPTWSPDGERIAYWTPADVPKVYVYVLESEISVELGDGAWPAWSADGRRMAYVDMRSGSARQTLRTMDPDGANVRNVFAADAWLGHPSWSPGGDVITFDRDPDGHMFCVANLRDGVWIEPPAPCAENSGTQPSTLWLVRPDGTGLRRLSGSMTDDHDATFTR